MAQADHAGVAYQQHQTDTCNGVDVNQGQFAKIEFIHDQGRQRDGQQQQAVPDALAVVFEQPDVLAVMGFEQEAHWNGLYLLALHGGEDTFGPYEQHQQ